MLSARSQCVLYDRYIVWTGLALACFGLLMVGSASMVTSYQVYHQPFHFVLRQGIFLLTGCLVALGMTRISLAFWEKNSFLLLGVSFFCLLLVLVPGIGTVINGSRRWIHVGPLSLQVSELVKLLVILYLAGFLQRHLGEVRTQLSGFVKPLIWVGLLSVLLLLEPDFGSTAVMTVVVLAVLFIAGAQVWPFILMLFFVLAGMSVLVVIAPYRLARVTSFWHPFAHAAGGGYQLTQSLIAFGRGGFLVQVLVMVSKNSFICPKRIPILSLL